VAAKGEFEVVYLGWDGKQRVPCAGLDYTSPYNNLPQNALAPGTTNTQTINGVLCSSPAISSSPFTAGSLPSSSEIVLGTFPGTVTTPDGIQTGVCTIIVTSVAVYASEPSNPSGSPPATVGAERLTKLHTWSGDINDGLVVPGQSVGFVQVLDTVYFSGYMFLGIFSIQIVQGVAPDISFTFATATDYVCSPYLFVLDGYMCTAGAAFPTGGGTGTAVLPTIAWSVPGDYTEWDPMSNPQAGYNELPDVSDRITGVSPQGRSAIIFRLRGLTQQDPNLGPGAGLEPFVWYHLWASPQGIGAYDNTVAQFGEIAVFRSSDNIYSISMTGGLTQVGTKIIPKINFDQARYGSYLATPAFNVIGLTVTGTVTYLASIVEISGELHYLLVMTWIPNTTFGIEVQPGSYVYDLNIADQTWNFWDLTQYFAATSTSPVFTTITSPIVQVKQVEVVATASSPSGFCVYSPTFYLFGAQVSGSLTPIGQFIPAAYNNGNVSLVYSQVLSPLYSIIEIPKTTLVFRGETISAGHKITWRRMRLQNDGVSLVSQTSQLVNTTMIGSNQQLVAPNVNVYPKNTGAPIQTYYADGNLSDEMIQCNMTTTVGAIGAQWASMATFRFTHVSFIGIDSTGTTQ